MTVASLESLLEGAVRNLKDGGASSPPAEVEAPDHPEPSRAEESPAEADARATGDRKDGSPPSQDDLPNDVVGLRSATVGERKRRQEAEKELQELKKRLSDLEGGGRQQPPAKETAKPALTPPDPWLDPEGYARFQADQIESARFRDRVEISQELMRSKHDDYDDIEKVFIEESKVNPFLAKQLRSAPFPARFAYEEGKKLKALREIGDPTAYRAKIEAELKAKFEAEKASQPSPEAASLPPKAQPAPPAPPPSLAGVTSSAPRKAAAKFEGPTPLEQILK